MPRRKRVIEYPDTTPGTIDARKARRAVSQMTRDQEDELFQIGIAIANGKSLPQAIRSARHKHPA